MMTSLATINLNMFIKKYRDIKKNRFGKKMESLNYKTYSNYNEKL